MGWSMVSSLDCRYRKCLGQLFSHKIRCAVMSLAQQCFWVAEEGLLCQAFKSLGDDFLSPVVQRPEPCTSLSHGPNIRKMCVLWGMLQVWWMGHLASHPRYQCGLILFGSSKPKLQESFANASILRQSQMV